MSGRSWGQSLHVGALRAQEGSGELMSALELPTEGPDGQGHHVTPSEVQGRDEAKGSAGDCALPFLTCKGFIGKGWLWSLAVHSSQMSRLSGVFAQSSGCAALQYRAQEELLLSLEGRPKLLSQSSSIVTATVAGKLSLPQSSREALPSACCSLCSTTFMLAKDLS